VKKSDRKNLKNRARRINWRLRPRNWQDQRTPFFRARDIIYQMGEKVKGVVGGGIGALHNIAVRVGLVEAINQSIPILKAHIPYHDSDHVLNIAYNVACGHTKLEEIEILRQDEGYMNMLGAQRIPDPTTAGDYLRRFTETSIEKLMDGINQVRLRVWDRHPEFKEEEGIIDTDGTITPTYGKKKEGMGYSYKGIWGYHPLLVSVANTREPLFIVNRPGNVVSHHDSVKWIDKAIDLAKQGFKSVLLRGDTDFALSKEFDRWTDEGVGFIFGYDAKQNLISLAETIPAGQWKELKRRAKYTIKTEPREKRGDTKEKIVEEKEWDRLRLKREEIAEIEYRPTSCKKTYRLVVLRKTIEILRGQQNLFDETKYIFYITNRWDLKIEEVVWHANQRCNQENLIEQLKNGVNALRLPVHDLVSNWAYMVIASLAWTLKAWFAMVLPKRESMARVLAMDYKTFLHTIILIPCLVVNSSRRIIIRIVGYTKGIKWLFQAVGRAKTLFQT